MLGHGFGMRGFLFGIGSHGFSIESHGFGMRGFLFGMVGHGFGMRYFLFSMAGHGFGIESYGFGMRVLVFGMPCHGLRKLKRFLVKIFFYFLCLDTSTSSAREQRNKIHISTGSISFIKLC